MELQPSALSGGIVGAGLRPTDRPLLKALERQDGLYTLVERDGHAETRTLIGSIVRVIDASSCSVALLQAIAAPETRIVSITVSEHGYHLGGVARTLNRNDPAIQRDIASPHRPATLLGILVEAYRQRRDEGNAPFTALSCDNIRKNGEVLRAAVLALAQLIDPELADWIAQNGCFPCSMVDRITPVPSTEQIAAFQTMLGSPDGAPQFSEHFRQWALQDIFAAGRPDWNRVGAEFVVDVAPYEALKLRLLNASHLAIASLGALCGHETILQTIADPLIRRYMIRLMYAEMAPTLPRLPGVNVPAYGRDVVRRFANPALRDTVRRVIADAPINLLLGPLRDCLAKGAWIDLLSIAIAAWWQRVKIDSALPIEGRPMGRAELDLQSRAQSSAPPISFLSAAEIFGDLGVHPKVVATVGRWLALLEKRGASETLLHAARAAVI